MEKDAGNVNTNIGYRIVRGSTVLTTLNYHGDTHLNASAVIDGPHLNWIDSPSSTSALVYKTETRSTNGYGNAYVNYGGESVIILMEISQ